MTTNILNYTKQLCVRECITCGIAFALPTELDGQLRKNHRTFYCPSGHHQCYMGKTAEQKELEQLRKDTELKDRQLATERARRDQAEAAAEHERNRVRGYQGALGKAKKRAARGVCPAPGCKRSFVDVARHVSTCHPDMVPSAGNTP